MRTKRILSILLSLVLVLGMLPGMSLTASAEGNTKTITPGTDDAKTGTGTMTITLKIKDVQTITASDVTATYGDTDKSVSGTTTGDGAISYSVKSGDAVTVDENTGALTIVKAGSAVITVTAAETATYAQATKDVNVTVNTKAMTVSAENVNVTVDGQPHGITVNVTEPASGATVKYGTEVGTYNLDASPTQTEAGELTVYYQVTADNYTTYTGSAKVTVNAKQTQTITASDVTATYGDTDKSVSGTTTGDGAISYSVKSGDAVTVDENTGALTIVKAGSAVITVTAAETATYAQATKDVNVTVNKAAPTVTAPTAKTLTYNGQKQELVNAGSTEDGTLYYAVTTENTAPTDENLYTTSIPTATDAGTYYVWYKVKADANHNDSNAASIPVTINKANITPTVKMDGWTAGETAKEPSLKDGSNPGNGKVTYTYAKKGENKFTSDKPTTAGQYTVKAEIAETDNYKGGSSTADFTIDEAKPEEKPTTTEEKNEEKTEQKTDAVVTTAPKAQKLTYNGKAQALVKAGKATGGKMQYALGKKTKATGSYSADIPTGTKAGTYYVWYKVKGDKNHNDTKAVCVKVTIAEAKKEQKTETKPFTDFRTLRLNASKRSKDAITLKWRKYADADGYLIYGSECGKDNMKLLKTIKGNKNVTWTHKKLKKGTYYKYKVVAYKNNKGKEKTLVNSTAVHTTTKGTKRTVAKAVKVNKNSVSIKKGKTFRIEASEVKDEKKKKIEHHRDICYESSNKKVATVNEKGKVKGVKKGTATIFVYSETGHYKTVKVTVK